ncbi:DUF2255 family protein [Ferrimonas balearica]|nr:DUF2255 family protein [Ferrimonas balearica]
MPWTRTQLDAIAAADDFRVAPFRADGETPGTPTFIWSVVTGGALYIRAYSGAGSRWYRAALDQGAGQVQAAGRTWDVTFHPVDDGVQDAVDDAYRAKYADSRYLAPMISDRARGATVEVRLRD